MPGRRGGLCYGLSLSLSPSTRICRTHSAGSHTSAEVVPDVRNDVSAFRCKHLAETGVQIGQLESDRLTQIDRVLKSL